MDLAIEAAGRTDIGCVRTNNEDDFGYDLGCRIFVVCDGMGGAAAGEVASKLAVSAVLDYFRQAAARGCYPLFSRIFEDCSEHGNALGNALVEANAAVYQAGLGHHSHSGMGTTIAAALVKETHVWIAHAGDSRVYLIRGATIEQLTNDHSLVMERVRQGVMTAEEAALSELQNVITRALGAEPEVEPDIGTLEVMAGDTLLLCSDGLVRHVTDNQILRLMQTAPSLEAASLLLIEDARQAGGSDNITCLLVRFVPARCSRNSSAGAESSWSRGLG